MGAIVQCGDVTFVHESEAASTGLCCRIRTDILSSSRALAGVSIIQILANSGRIAVIQGGIQAFVDLFDAHATRTVGHLVHVAVATLAGVLLGPVDFLAGGGGMTVVPGTIEADAFEAFAA